MTSYISSIKKQLTEDNSDDEPKASDDSFLKKDFEKLKSLWRNVKEHKGNQDTNLSYEGIKVNTEVKEDPSARFQENQISVSFKDKREYEYEIKSLRDKLGYTESRLAKLQDFNTSLNDKLSRAELELKECYSRLAKYKQNYVNQVKAIEIDDMNMKMSTLSISNQNELEKLKIAYDDLKAAMIEKQYKVEHLEQRLKESHEEIQSLKNHVVSYSDKEFENILRENRQLREKIDESEKNLDNLYLLRKNESAVLIEVERQKADIIRLIQLLEKTEEFQEFAENAQLANFQVRYLKEAAKKRESVKNAKLFSEMNKEKNSHETLFWVPLDAFKFAHDLRLKFKGQFTEDILEMLLLELNKIWTSKEQKAIASLKEKHATEIKEYKRQMALHRNAPDPVAKKVVARLKDQLHKNAKELQTIKRSKRTSELDILANTIKAATDNHDRIKHLENEKKNLQNKLGRLENNQFTTDELKIHFLEGAIWMHETIMQETERLISNLSQSLQEYENKLQGYESDEEGAKSRNYTNRKSWITSNIESIINSFYEALMGLMSKVQSIKSSTLEN